MSRGDEKTIAQLERGRKTNPISASDQQIERAVAAYMDRFFKQNLSDLSRLREVVETLNGDRGGVESSAARIGLISQLLSVIPAQPSSRKASVEPTLDEYNALVDDIHRIYAGMAALRFALQQT